MSNEKPPYDTKFELKDGEGYLWRETNSEVQRKGPILWRGKKRYASIIKTEVNGEAKYELSISAGLLYINEEGDKRDPETSPDISGPITLDGEMLKCGGWKNVSETGNKYTKVRLELKEKNKGPKF